MYRNVDPLNQELKSGGRALNCLLINPTDQSKYTHFSSVCYLKLDIGEIISGLENKYRALLQQKDIYLFIKHTLTVLRIIIFILYCI